MHFIGSGVSVGYAVNVEGKREIVGLDVGSEDGAFWLSFLRSLVARGLKELIISDAHQGLRNAIATVFGGAGSDAARTS